MKHTLIAVLITLTWACTSISSQDNPQKRIIDAITKMQANQEYLVRLFKFEESIGLEEAHGWASCREGKDSEESRKKTLALLDELQKFIASKPDQLLP